MVDQNTIDQIRLKTRIAIFVVNCSVKQLINTTIGNNILQHVSSSVFDLSYFDPPY